MKLRVLSALLLAFGLSMVSVAGADIIAEFEGATSGAVDGYVGVAGSGWGNSWSVKASGATAAGTWMKSGMTDYVPFDADNDNYLQLKITRTAAGKGSVVRNYMGTGANVGDVDYAQDYTISFSFRADYMAGFGTSNSDNFIFWTDVSSTTNYGPNSTATYQIKVPGGHATHPEYAKKWLFVDANQDGTYGTEISTGVDLVQGTIYDFVITMHPATQTYDAMVTDGTHTYSSITAYPQGLGWRTASTANNQTMLAFGGAEADSGYATMAIDNIRIANVPEPSTLILLVSALLALSVCRKK